MRPEERVENFSDSIGSPARDFSVCTAVPQPTAPPRTLTQLFTCRPTVGRDASEVGVHLTARNRVHLNLTDT